MKVLFLREALEIMPVMKQKKFIPYLSSAAAKLPADGYDRRFHDTISPFESFDILADAIFFIDLIEHIQTIIVKMSAAGCEK